jgi:xanthine dehydrogenase accessory factor
MKICRVVIRGGGDIATGVAHKLKRCGMEVVILECEKPTAIRRKVAFSEAVYEKESAVEGISGVLVSSLEEVVEELKDNNIPVLIDPKGESIKELEPHVVVDAIIAKKNLGTEIDMAPLVIALGPGFTAGKDCHVVVETMRGHDLGRLIYEGVALANTGNPGNIGGYSVERVIHSPAEGVLKAVKNIGDRVSKGETIAVVGETQVKTQLPGVVRGILRDGIIVKKGIKMADVDPRYDQAKNCYTISDKARCIGGAVVEGIMAKFFGTEK